MTFRPFAASIALLNSAKIPDTPGNPDRVHFTTDQPLRADKTYPSGTVSPEKSSRTGGSVCRRLSQRGWGACCWNGSNMSLPNQPPPKPPPPRCGCGRCWNPPKLKNCAEVGPTTPNRAAFGKDAQPFLACPTCSWTAQDGEPALT